MEKRSTEGFLRVVALRKARTFVVMILALQTLACRILVAFLYCIPHVQQDAGVVCARLRQHRSGGKTSGEGSVKAWRVWRRCISCSSWGELFLSTWGFHLMKYEKYIFLAIFHHPSSVSVDSSPEFAAQHVSSPIDYESTS